LKRCFFVQWNEVVRADYCLWRAYPFKFDEDGKLAKPPDSKHHDDDLTEVGKAEAVPASPLLRANDEGDHPPALTGLGAGDRRIKAIFA
jgi:hypothetical protein